MLTKMKYLLLDGGEVPLEAMVGPGQGLDRLQILAVVLRGDRRILLDDPTDRLVSISVEHVNLAQYSFY